MIKIIASKNEGEAYTLANKEKNRLKITSSFIDLDISEASVKAQDISIFGTVDAYFIKITRSEDLFALTKDLLTTLKDSGHFFLILVHGKEFIDAVESAGGTVQKIEEKKVFDFPADLVAALQKGDKKNSWNLMLKELNHKDAEPIHGSCVFAYKTLLVYLNDKKHNSRSSGVKDFSWSQAKKNGGGRDRDEVVAKYFELVMAYHRARSGKGTLAQQLEKWVLE
jgi:hypothetical protein